VTLNISKIIVAVLIAVIVGIVLVGLLGPVLISIEVPIAVTVGKFFVNWGFVLGLVAGLWYYFTGGTP